jgi:hypothetical protein
MFTLGPGLNGRQFPLRLPERPELDLVGAKAANRVRIDTTGKCRWSLMRKIFGRTGHTTNGT